MLAPPGKVPQNRLLRGSGCSICKFFSIMVPKLTEGGMDVSNKTVGARANLIKSAKEIVWNGPL